MLKCVLVLLDSIHFRRHGVGLLFVVGLWARGTSGKVVFWGGWLFHLFAVVIGKLWRKSSVSFLQHPCRLKDCEGETYMPNFYYIWLLLSVLMLSEKETRMLSDGSFLSNKEGSFLHWIKSRCNKNGKRLNSHLSFDVTRVSDSCFQGTVLR